MERSFTDNILYYMEDGATFGSKMGVLGISGKMIGELICGIFGLILGVINALFDNSQDDSFDVFNRWQSMQFVYLWNE